MLTIRGLIESLAAPQPTFKMDRRSAGVEKAQASGRWAPHVDKGPVDSESRVAACPPETHGTAGDRPIHCVPRLGRPLRFDCVAIVAPIFTLGEIHRLTGASNFSLGLKARIKSHGMPCSPQAQEFVSYGIGIY